MYFSKGGCDFRIISFRRNNMNKNFMNCFSVGSAPFYPTNVIMYNIYKSKLPW